MYNFDMWKEGYFRKMNLVSVYFVELFMVYKYINFLYHSFGRQDSVNTGYKLTNVTESYFWLR